MKKLLLVASSLVFVAVPLAALSQDYSDPAVEYVIGQQIMYPAGDGKFYEEETVSRLEFTLVVVDRFYGNQDMGRCFDDLALSFSLFFTRLFSDVDAGEWYAPRLCVAMRAGLIQGNADGTFRPFAPINAAEAAKILARAYGIAAPPPTAQSPWYEGAMDAMRSRGAIAARSAPATHVRRAAMARMFYALRNEIPVGTRSMKDETEDPAVSEGDDFYGTEFYATDNKTPSIADEQDGCPIFRVNSPGTAMLVLGIEARPRTLERRSHRVMLQQAKEAYQSGSPKGPDGGVPATNLLERCAGAFVRTPGGGLIFTGTEVPRAVTDRIPNRILRAGAQNRREIDDPRINRNVGY